jgi:hypothetical protein
MENEAKRLKMFWRDAGRRENEERGGGEVAGDEVRVN